MEGSIQQPGIAGTFYPADPGQLAAEVDASLAKAAPPRLLPKAVIAPHAGHVYSGDIAGAAYKLLGERKGEIKRVVLLGPNHRVAFRGMALSPSDAWATPLGALAVDRAGRDALARTPGVMVTPEPFVEEHSLEVHLPFIQRALGPVEIVPVLVGEAPRDQVANALELLWGGPETAIIVSSDLSHFHDYQTCKAKDEQTVIGIERHLSDVCTGDRACGKFAIDGLLVQARARDLRVTALDVRNSGDTHGPRDRVVGYGSFAFEYAYAAQIDAEARQALLHIARMVLRERIRQPGAPIQVRFERDIPTVLKAQRATFVTLNIAGQLRGCRGSILPQRSLVLDVAENALNSAFDDPRFPPLTEAELEQISLHVSILSTPRRIAINSEAELAAALQPDKDGLIIRDGGRQALFLPSVWETLPDPQAFIHHLKAKAGLSPDHWSPNFEAYRFVTESFGDGIH